mgnify:CR=1 FL=1
MPISVRCQPGEIFGKFILFYKELLWWWLARLLPDISFFFSWKKLLQIDRAALHPPPLWLFSVIFQLLLNNIDGANLERQKLQFRLTEHISSSPPHLNQIDCLQSFSPIISQTYPFPRSRTMQPHADIQFSLKTWEWDRSWIYNVHVWVKRQILIVEAIVTRREEGRQWKQMNWVKLLIFKWYIWCYSMSKRIEWIKLHFRSKKDNKITRKSSKAIDTSSDFSNWSKNSMLFWLV